MTHNMPLPRIALITLYQALCGPYSGMADFSYCLQFKDYRRIEKWRHQKATILFYISLARMIRQRDWGGPQRPGCGMQLQMCVLSVLFSDGATDAVPL